MRCSYSRTLWSLGGCATGFRCRCRSRQGTSFLAANRGPGCTRFRGQEEGLHLRQPKGHCGQSCRRVCRRVYYSCHTATATAGLSLPDISYHYHTLLSPYGYPYCHHVMHERTLKSWLASRILSPVQACSRRRGCSFRAHSVRLLGVAPTPSTKSQPGEHSLSKMG